LFADIIPSLVHAGFAYNPALRPDRRKCRPAICDVGSGFAREFYVARYKPAVTACPSEARRRVGDLSIGGGERDGVRYGATAKE